MRSLLVDWKGSEEKQTPTFHLKLEKMLKDSGLTGHHLLDVHGRELLHLGSIPGLQIDGETDLCLCVSHWRQKTD